MPAKRTSQLVRCKYFHWLLSQRKGTWWADGRTNRPAAPRKSLGTSDFDEALKLLEVLDRFMAVKLGIAKESVLDDVESQNLGLEKGAKLYLDHAKRPAVAGGVSKKSAARYKAVLDKFIAFLVQEGVASWNQVKKHHLEGYAAWLDGESYAYRTEFLELTTIKQAIKFLVSEGHLPEGSQIKLPLPRPTETDTYCYRPEEVTAMLEHCEKQPELNWLRNILVCLACTGMRISELAALRWSDISLEDNTITLKDESRSRRISENGIQRKTKSRRSRSFPIHADLRKVLELLAKERTTGQVFVGLKGAPIRPDLVRNALIKHVIEPLKTKFPSDEDEIGFKDGRLHSFRHYFCSMCANSGVPEQVVMRWLGHRSSAMVAHYYHLHDEESQRQMKRLNFTRRAETT